MADSVHDEYKPPEVEVLSQLEKLYQSVPENSKKALAEKVATEVKKLAQSVGAVPRSVVESFE